MLGSKPNTHELKPEDFIAIRDFIHETSGIYISDNKKYIIENRLARRMSELGVKTYKDYFYLVKYDNTRKEFNQLMNLITTNETSFFRNESQLTAFSDEILPQLLDFAENRGGRILRIWSAGCSTGEEPYTIAMILMEKIRDMKSWQIEIQANDISEQVLQSARRGVYGESAFRTTDRYFIDKYFTREPEGYRMNDDVRKIVKFTHLNLVDRKKMAIMRDFDVIFCRNVMMYFSSEVRIATARHFYGSLRPGGYLLIGHSESLHNVSRAFKLSYLKNALVYMKENTGGLASVEAASHDEKPTSSGNTTPTLKTLEAMEHLLAAKK